MALDRDKYRNTCVHFNGMQNDACKAGVCYDTLAGEPKAGSWARLPCLGYPTKMGVETVFCDKRAPYTEADIDAREKQIEDAFDRMRKAGPVIIEIRKANKGRSNQGTVPCPACVAGTLHWSIAGYNGHMHGRCTSAGCLNWME